MKGQGAGQKRWRRTRGFIALALIYAAAAYVVLPEVWRVYERLAGSSSLDMVTRTTADIPGDPINVGLVGSKAEVIAAFAKAGWDTADPITLKTSIEIGLAVLFDRPFPDAPVSTLLYDGRPQDLAFEKPIGDSPDRRNHVRFWLMPEPVEDRPYWLGSASLDIGSGISHDTGQITHHIGPNVDAERELVMRDLSAASAVERQYAIAGRGATQAGRNGGGDTYITDGKAEVAVLRQP